MPKTILLLNPPGDEQYLREYFCPKVSKASFYYPPLDLVYTSGWFPEDCDVQVIDAIADALSVSATLQQILANRPEYIYILVSSPSFSEDRLFIKQLRDLLPDAVLIGTGDVLRELKASSFETVPQLDAINLNFSTDSVVRYVNEPQGLPLANMIYRFGDRLITAEEFFPKKRNDIPPPRWDLFPIKKYRYPFAIHKYNVAMLSDFGCAYLCTFCPLGEVDFSLRPRNFVFEEIEQLVTHGVRDIFFYDQTFGVNKKATFELCDFLKTKDIGWTCFSRVDVVDEERLAAMAEAGCHTILFGIESSNEDILMQYKKNTVQSQMLSAIQLCKKYRIRTVGTFIVGLPGESRESIRNTIRFASYLELDFASFNVATPAIGTELRRDMIQKGWVDGENIENLESAKQRVSTWAYHDIGHGEILDLHRYAIRSFYLRPKYLIKRLFSVRSWHELQSSIKEGFYLVFDG